MRKTRYVASCRRQGALRIIFCQQGDDNIRIDSGVYEGSEISIYYDPMISKVIAYGENREEAINKLRIALDEYYIRGVGHNISFLSDVLKSPRFKSGDISTKFIEEEYKDGFNGGTLSLEAWNIMIAVATTVHSCEIGRQSTISGKMNEDASAFIGNMARFKLTAKFSRLIF